MGAIRFSLGRWTTDDEVEQVVEQSAPGSVMTAMTEPVADRPEHLCSLARNIARRGDRGARTASDARSDGQTRGRPSSRRRLRRWRAGLHCGIARRSGDRSRSRTRDACRSSLSRADKDGSSRLLSSKDVLSASFSRCCFRCGGPDHRALLGPGRVRLRSRDGARVSTGRPPRPRRTRTMEPLGLDTSAARLARLSDLAGSTLPARRRTWRLAKQAGLSVKAIRGVAFYPPLGFLARIMAPLDPWLGRRTTFGAAFIALRAVRGADRARR